MRTSGVSKGSPGLARLVREYRENHKMRLDRLLAFYRNQSSLKDAIRTAALALDYNCKRHGHQRRIPPASLEQVRDILLRKADRISRCMSFDDLHFLIGKATSEVPRFGELGVYDAALRIGSYIGVYPRKVHLHRGTRLGCSALGLVGLDCKGKTMTWKQLPRAIRALRPWEIEDFLCIYKDKLKP